MEKDKKMSIEDSFSALDEIIGKLEGNEISLEQSFAYYEAGMKLVQSCGAQIDKVEKRIQVLSQKGEERI